MPREAGLPSTGVETHREKKTTKTSRKSTKSTENRREKLNRSEEQKTVKRSRKPQSELETPAGKSIMPPRRSENRRVQQKQRN